MFEYIYNFFAVVFGYIMNFFYIILDAVGLPYLWLCIVLFSISSRLITLPQKIRSSRKRRLATTINYEMRKLRDSYGTIKKDDRERIKAYKKDTKAIFKKYNVSSGTGCLTMLLQFPIFVGLFRVVKRPFEYVPQFHSLTEAEKIGVNDFFGLSIEALPQAFGALGIIVPLIVFLGTLLHVAPNLFNKNTKKQPALLVLYIIQPLLLTWMSFCFPIAISLYWVTNDLANLALTKIVNKCLDRNQEINRITAETEALIAAEKEAEEAEKARLAAEQENQSSSVNSIDEHIDEPTEKPTPAEDVPPALAGEAM